MYMLEKCRLQNKPVILHTNPLKSLNINKPITSKISIIDYSVKEGIDAIVLKDENSDHNSYISTIKSFISVLLQIEAYEDNKSKYEELSK